MSGLQASLRRAAGRVWRDMADAERLGLFLNEETITESALLFLARRNTGNGLFVRPYSKREEKLVGADWEWWYVDRNRSVTMRVQAKRLYPTSEYCGLRVKGQQIDTFINMVGTSHPVYVFYNDKQHGGQVVSGNGAAAACCDPSQSRNDWGCTIAHAAQVKCVSSNRMADLLSVSMPWHCLLCPNRARRKRLPYIVATNLNSIFHETDRFVEPTEPAKWVKRLMELAARSTRRLAESDMRSNDPELDAYLTKRNLAGVVVFHGDLEQE